MADDLPSAATQLVLYENDAVEISYHDGGYLQLSPCGAVFIYQAPPDRAAHPLLEEKKIQQRTQFVTSVYRTMVQEALDFRNRFAARPYLCKEAMDQSAVTAIHRDLVETRWPESPSVITESDGSLTVNAEDNYSSVTLAPCRQMITVSFMCKTSQQRPKGFPGNTNRTSVVMSSHQNSAPKEDGCHTVIDQMSSLHLNNTDDKNTGTAVPPNGSDCRWFYARVVQHYSIDDYPASWFHPVSRLLEAAKKNSNCVRFQDSNDQTSVESEEPSKKMDVSDGQTQKSVSILLPKSLPTNCSSPHLHKWAGHPANVAMVTKPDSRSQGQGRLKVVCSQGVIYRFMRSESPGIEIHPGDGSMMRSSGLTGHYFKHWIYKGSKVEEKIHSVIHPPPDVSGVPYSVSKLVTRGARFLEHLCEENAHILETSMDDRNCCWKVPQTDLPEAPPSRVLLDECTVQGIGRFTAYSGGRVRIVFTDRTCLETIADFSKRNSQNAENHSEMGVDTVRPPAISAPIYPHDLPQGVCRLLLPNGYYQNVLRSEPGEYHRYLSAAEEWIQWVNSSPTERYSFYKDTIHDWDKWLAVDSEIKKISCFNYIMEHTVLSQFKSPGDPPLTDPIPPHHDHHDVMSSNLYTSDYLNHSSISAITHAEKSQFHQITPKSDDLNCFNFSELNDAMAGTFESLESRLGTDPGGAVNTEMTFRSVEDVLRQTSAAIHDIEVFIDQNGPSHH